MFFGLNSLSSVVLHVDPAGCFSVTDTRVQAFVDLQQHNNADFAVLCRQFVTAINALFNALFGAW